jgi:hypothetical protein
MNVLGLLATVAVTEKWGIDQQVLKLWSHQQNIAHERLPHGPIAQLTPVDQLANQLDDDTQPLGQPETAAQNEQWQRVEDLENRDSDPEVPQFSPTVFLTGETIFGVSGVTGRAVEDAVVGQGSVELILGISFTGEDLLEVGIESGNATAFSYVDELTFEGRLGFPSETDGDRFEISELSYEFPIGDRATIYISTSGDNLDDFNPLLGDSSNGAISEFATENPIYALVPDVGLQLNYDLTEELGISFGYFSEDAGSSKPGAGLFNGNHSAFLQLGFEPSDSFLLGLTYIHTYNNSSLETELGSLRSQLNLERPVIGNSYGISTLFMPSPRLAIGGWVGLTTATVFDLGTADVWNYALTLAFPDFGKEGNLLGVVVGQEPRLTRTSGFTIDDRSSDPDTSLHIEAFYRDRLSDNISITPGLIWITAPNHDNSNPHIIIFTVRTTFEF